MNDIKKRAREIGSAIVDVFRELESANDERRWLQPIYLQMKLNQHIPARSVRYAELPGNYIAARNALRLCAKRFTPERYVRATMAMEELEATDEAAAWPPDNYALASYVRMAALMDDFSELERLSRRVEEARAAWKAKQSDG